MRVILITHGKVNPNGHNGISRVVYNLNRHSKNIGIHSEIWSVVDGVKHEEDFVRDEYVTIKCFPRIRKIKANSNEICKKIIMERDGIDLIHFHMPWLLDKLAIAKTCKEMGIPYIVTGHSAYSTNQKQSWKMKLGKLYEVPFLNHAASVHAITREESSEFRKFGIASKIFVIPNSIEDPCVSCVMEDARTSGSELIKVLFMGELRVQKNIDGLIKAVSYLPQEYRNKLVFWIVGPDSNGNLEKYLSLSKEYNVQNQFQFMGGIFGDERKRLFCEADIYITPSLSEVISLSAIEAMAYGKPCVLTRQSDVAYFYNYNFFVMCENDSYDIARAIKELLDKKSSWKTMGENARLCYEENFKWDVNIIKFHEKYRELVGHK